MEKSGLLMRLQRRLLLLGKGSLLQLTRQLAEIVEKTVRTRERASIRDAASRLYGFSSTRSSRSFR